MFPGSTVSPPYRLVPSLWLCESRPLREEPPAFLCAIERILTRVDVGDLDLGIMLAMPALAMRVLAPLLLEGHDLVGTHLFHDLTRNARARNQRRAELVARHQHFAESHG